MKIISAASAAALIQDHWTIIPGGFGSCGHPDALTQALATRFDATEEPRGLTLLFAAGAGDRAGRGLDAIARQGLVRRAIGGFWGLAPALGTLALQNKIEAHNWPQGVLSQMFRAIAAGQPGVLSRIGIGTFVDPEVNGGCLNSRTGPSPIRKMSIAGQLMLFYPTMKVNCALLRGTASDPHGNISAENEVSFQDSLSQAMAARNSGGIVVVQVERLVDAQSIHPHHVRIPGLLVDYVVVAGPHAHPQTYGDQFNSSFVTAGAAVPGEGEWPAAHRVIARRALGEIRTRPGAAINLGIGIPAIIGQIAALEGYAGFEITVESGQVGGVPAAGLSFGASIHPSAVIEQSALFDFYDGGGLDIACLGFAQVDSQGDVNVSRFAGRLQGAGGFINISQSAGTVLFCGTFTTGGLSTQCRDRRLTILREGSQTKFVDRVAHKTFSGRQSVATGQTVKFITERAVFSYTNGLLQLDEIAPGMALDDDIVPFIDASFVVSAKCRRMDANLFT